MNAYAGAIDRELWAFDRQTGQEQRVWQTSDNDGLHLNGTTSDGAVLIRTGSELRSLSAHSWRIEKIDPDNNAAVVSPDGRALAIVIAGSLHKEGQSHDSRLFIVDTATARQRALVGKYEAPVWSPSGTRIAAIADDGLAIIDVATRKEVARVGWPKPDRAPEDLVWSPDEKSVLAGLYGENGGSGDPQRDYFLLNIAARTWTPAVTAQKAIWLQGSPLLYLRPVGTAAGAGKQAQRLDCATCRFRPRQHVGYRTNKGASAERLSVTLRSVTKQKARPTRKMGAPVETTLAVITYQV